MSSKHPMSEMLPSPSSKEEALRKNRIDKCPILIGYNPVEACSRVTEKHFEAPTRRSTNQLTLSCRILHNIISHIIVPRKGHLDEVNHYDLFLLDSILVGEKLDFSYIMLNHMNTVHRGHRPMALPYGMIVTKIFQHFKVSFGDEIVLNPKPTDTINILTLKCMRIFKEDGEWMAKTKEFDDESGPSTLPFEGGKEIDADKDAPPPRPRSQRPSSSTPALLLPRTIIIFLMVKSTCSHLQWKTYTIWWKIYNNQ
ncbi:Uncharacterized protein Adt_27630 [Abeliophyllum distichum]|uniref:Uncharacterized protein n=1 Tax=Abeliophyllum distichum TaxID=126358 RepID=A0ABD1RUA9_9LAMI